MPSIKRMCSKNENLIPVILIYKPMGETTVSSLWDKDYRVSESE